MSEKTKKAGRPPLRDESERRDKKVMLTFTESEYEHLKNMQTLLNRQTLTSTIHFFLDRGMKSLEDEFSRGR
ncbi:hypothetical protein [Sulfurimonas sp.]|jgi:hypothetical protein|uniref:hypothetical protein n=1 Tax=Sulfurimonas sp. TaxID=2022749 RepID=UPI003D128268